MPDWDKIRKNEENKRKLRRKCGVFVAAEPLRQAALADPDNPGLWGLYVQAVKHYEARNRPHVRPKPQPKKPVVDPLELGQSQLVETLWTGPPPAYDTTPGPGKAHGEGEPPETSGEAGNTREYPPETGGRKSLS